MIFVERFPVMRPALLYLLFVLHLAGQTAFDVASIKLNKSGNQLRNSNVPLGPGDAYTPNGGYLNATNYPLLIYIMFAYNVPVPQLDGLANQMPAWVTADRFDIQARVAGNPTKDQMRTMMRMLLAERCKLAIHEEANEVPVLALVLVKPGILGPLLQQHPVGTDCPLDASPNLLADDKRFPLRCGGKTIMPASAPGLVHLGARNVTMPFIANLLSESSRADRPIVDKTGLEGRFDFTIEFAPGTLSASPNAPPQPELAGPTVEQALKVQMGVKLQSQKSSITVLKVDHIERPSEN